MKISDITCRDCGASYQMAESTSVSGPSGHHSCAICGSKLAEWDDGTLKAVRLMMSPQHRYGRVPVPPAPEPVR